MSARLSTRTRGLRPGPPPGSPREIALPAPRRFAPADRLSRALPREVRWASAVAGNRREGRSSLEVGHERTGGLARLAAEAR